MESDRKFPEHVAIGQTGDSSPRSCGKAEAGAFYEDDYGAAGLHCSRPAEENEALGFESMLILWIVMGTAVLYFR